MKEPNSTDINRMADADAKRNVDESALRQLQAISRGLESSRRQEQRMAIIIGVVFIVIFLAIFVYYAMRL